VASLSSLTAQGGAKVQDAFYIYQELGEKYNWTVRAVHQAPSPMAFQ
jgi:Coatomer epsilon subunit